MKLLVDVDGVLADLIPLVVAWVNDRYMTQFRPSFVREWNQLFPFTGTDVGEVVEYIMLWSDLLLKIRSIKHSRWGMAMLAVEHDITIATARPFSAFAATQEWLRRRQIHYDQFVKCFGSSKADVGGDVLIDDNVDNCLAFAATGRTAILFSQPWNQEFIPADGSRVIRAKDWADVLRIVKGMGEEA